jgi:hypothetical protein
MLADAAAAPRQTAAAAATAATPTTATASPATASAAAAAASAASAAPSQFLAELRCGGVLFVEDVESPQADVGEFFFTQRHFVI